MALPHPPKKLRFVIWSLTLRGLIQLTVLGMAKSNLKTKEGNQPLLPQTPVAQPADLRAKERAPRGKPLTDCSLRVLRAFD